MRRVFKCIFATALFIGLWNRVCTNFNSFLANPAEAIKLLDDSHFFYYSFASQNSNESDLSKRLELAVYRDMGERNEARKDLQFFLKLLKIYVEMPSEKLVHRQPRRQKHGPTSEEVDEDDAKPESNAPKFSFVENFRQLFARTHEEKVDKQPVIEIAVSKQPEELDIDGLVSSILSQQFSLHQMYSDVLKETVPELLNRADSAKQRARVFLDEAKDVIDGIH